MPKRKAPELDSKDQYKRFKEAAKEAGVTDSEGDFEHAFAAVSRKAPRAAAPKRSRTGTRRR